MTITIIGPGVEEWGFIPGFLDESDPRKAREQIDSRYLGGWRKMEGFEFDPSELTLAYPKDPVMSMISALIFRDEVLLLYPGSWVVIVQHDGAWEAARMD